MKFFGDIQSLTALEVCGIVLLAYLFVYRPLKFLLRWFSNNVFCNCAHKRILKPCQNDYAVITGGSDGIGLEYARQLAEKGYNLMLISRTEEKLKRVAGEIQKHYPKCKKVEILAVDFSQPDIYNRIKQKLHSLDGQIRILVNNVGIMYPTPEYFASYPEGFHQKLINTNIVSMTTMSEIVLQIMAKQPLDTKNKKTRGVVINVSSSMGNTVIPLFNSYGASKAYVNYLSKCLATEYDSQGILVQTVTPGQVETSLSESVRDSSISVPANKYVRYALKALGTEQETNAHPLHKLINNTMLLVGDLLFDSWYMKLKFSAIKSMIKSNNKQEINNLP